MRWFDGAVWTEHWHPVIRPAPSAPDQSGHEPSAGLGFAVFGLFVGAQVVVGVVVAVALAAGAGDIGLEAIVAFGLLGQVVGLLAVVALLRHRMAPDVALVGPRPFRGWHLAAGFGVGVVGPFGVGLYVLALQSLFGLEDPEPVGLMAELQDVSGLLLVAMTVSVVVAAPLVEEVVFRRALFGGIKRRLGLAWGVVLSSALFGLVHLDVLLNGPIGLLQITALMGVGAAFALLHHATGNLAAPITAHATYNAIIVTLGFVAA